MKIVSILEVDRKMSTVAIKKWEFCSGQAHRTQRVEVKTGEASSVRVSCDPLILEFEKLFLRQPSLPNRTDIELDNETLVFFRTLNLGNTGEQQH